MAVSQSLVDLNGCYRRPRSSDSFWRLENDHDVDFDDCPMVAGPTSQYLLKLCPIGLVFTVGITFVIFTFSSTPSTVIVLYTRIQDTRLQRKLRLTTLSQVFHNNQNLLRRWSCFKKNYNPLSLSFFELIDAKFFSQNLSLLKLKRNFTLTDCLQWHTNIITFNMTRNCAKVRRNM
jgi:hypothetical protein